jgi:DNA-binding NtrC family response regulator
MARVLLIDDEEYVRMTLTQALEDDGHDVLVAINGQDGLNRYKAEMPDLVVTDVLMPEKEGIETILELRKIDPNAKIIVISGGGRINNLDFLEVARKFGATAALKKPFPIDEFSRVVAECLA